ncbi:AEC family transporter [Geomicrobium sediminis]|uniref:Permease n=1 Tax=Geomicrobium sediminis TaxID=1347788 RepID=A0ABS2PFT4_9BACL|nr:AEC family transporter [Geomicrobium sediminis]MBM7634107.1 putative permease [Geomicrobium sediminis]
MDVATITLTISMMGIIILFGALVSWRKTVTPSSKKLVMSLVINIAVPFIILNGVFNTPITDDVLQLIFLVFVISLGFNSTAIVLSILIARLLGFQPTTAKKLSLLSAIGNTGFIAIPLCAAVFGPIGGLLAAIFDAGLDVVLFTLGVAILQSGHQRFTMKSLTALINMPLIAIVVGLTFAVSGLQAPLLLQELSAMLAGLAAPLAMLYIGLLLPPFFKEQKTFFYRSIGFPLTMRLLIFPMTTILIVGFLPIDLFLKQFLVIVTAMPTFLVAPVIYGSYTDFEDEAAITTISSTLLSLLTIPLVSSFASFWFT